VKLEKATTRTFYLLHQVHEEGSRDTYKTLTKLLQGNASRPGRFVWKGV